MLFQVNLYSHPHLFVVGTAYFHLWFDPFIAFHAIPYAISTAFARAWFEITAIQTRCTFQQIWLIPWSIRAVCRNTSGIVVVHSKSPYVALLPQYSWYPSMTSSKVFGEKPIHGIIHPTLTMLQVPAPRASSCIRLKLSIMFHCSVLCTCA